MSFEKLSLVIALLAFQKFNTSILLLNFNFALVLIRKVSVYILLQTPVSYDCDLNK